MVVEMEQMASRPFSTIPLLIEHQADLLNTKKEPPDLRGSSRRKKVLHAHIVPDSVSPAYSYTNCKRVYASAIFFPRLNSVQMWLIFTMGLLYH